jgi:hypothetical protein
MKAQTRVSWTNSSGFQQTGVTITDEDVAGGISVAPDGAAGTLRGVLYGPASSLTPIA